MVTLLCPICSRPFDPQESEAMPFCSERCREVDLGRWLDEAYGLSREPEEERAPPDEEGQEDRC
jgi:uncharacterized protein